MAALAVNVTPEDIYTLVCFFAIKQLLEKKTECLYPQLSDVAIFLLFLSCNYYGIVFCIAVTLTFYLHALCVGQSIWESSCHFVPCECAFFLYTRLS